MTGVRIDNLSSTINPSRDASVPVMHNGQTFRYPVGQILSFLIDGAGEDLDTLAKLAAAINDDPAFHVTVAAAIAQRLATNENLSDIQSASAARANLGLNDPANMPYPMSKSPSEMEWLSNNSIRVLAGRFRSEDDTVNIELPSDIDITGISEGNDAHRHVLAGIDGSSNPAATLSSTVALPGGWNAFRRVGSILTDSSGNVRRFGQRGDRFDWHVPLQIINTTSISDAAGVALFAFCPIGVPVEARTIASLRSSVSSRVRVYSKLIDDLAVSTAATVVVRASGDTPEDVAERLTLTEDGEILIRRGNSNPSDFFVLVSTGYIDRRGRDK